MVPIFGKVTKYIEFLRNCCRCRFKISAVASTTRRARSCSVRPRRTVHALVVHAARSQPLSSQITSQPNQKLNKLGSNSASSELTVSSIRKGNTFEDEVFALVSFELAAERLGMLPSAARVFKRKGYYSRDRDSDIVIDVSIEVWLPNAENWSLLWACECKDYSHSVPVDDLEEFKSKLDQITGANRKGAVAVRGALQSGALRYARANGIAVIRVLPDRQVEHLIHYRASDAVPPIEPGQLEAALTNPDFTAKTRSFFAECDGLILSDWRSLIRRMLSEETTMR